MAIKAVLVGCRLVLSFFSKGRQFFNAMRKPHGVRERVRDREKEREKYIERKIERERERTINDSIQDMEKATQKKRELRKVKMNNFKVDR